MKDSMASMQRPVDLVLVEHLLPSTPKQQLPTAVQGDVS